MFNIYIFYCNLCAVASNDKNKYSYVDLSLLKIFDVTSSLIFLGLSTVRYNNLAKNYKPM